LVQVAPRDTVFIVDDDASVRAALGSLLRSVGLHVELYASAREFLSALSAISAPSASCVVLDVRMPGLSGLDCQRELADAGVHIPIIFMTGHGDIPMSVRAMKAGAVEFLTKPCRDQELLDAIGHALDRDRVRRVHDSEVSVLHRRFERLTAREREVMAWVVTGRLNKQIAEQLGTSEVTVKVHRGHVMRKMQADSVADLVRMAAHLGLASIG